MQEMANKCSFDQGQINIKMQMNDECQKPIQWEANPILFPGRERWAKIKREEKEGEGDVGSDGIKWYVGA